jgi:hypothetical protein
LPSANKALKVNSKIRYWNMKIFLKVTLSIVVLASAFSSSSYAQQTQEQLCQAKARNKTGCKCAVQTGGAVRQDGNWSMPTTAMGRQTFAACVEKNGGSMR